MAYTVSGKHDMLNALAAIAPYISLHSGDPGATGTANEISTSPYIRKLIFWLPAGTNANGVIELASQPVFDLLAGSVVAYAAGWTAETSGVCKWTAALVDSTGTPDPKTFDRDGTHTVTIVALDLNA